MENNLFWTIERASSYGITIQRARRFNDEEKTHYVEDFKELGLVSVGDHIELPLITWEDMPKRAYDGAFLGCNNQSWIITEEEKERYIALNAQRETTRKEKKRNDEIEALKKEISHMRSLGKLPSRAEAHKKAKEYNYFQNEGGYGYVPHFYCAEELNEAEMRLAKLVGDAE